MLFTSLAFIVFLAVLLIVYYAIPQRFRWYVLLAGSLAFFAFAGLTYLLYIVLTVGSAYAVTLQIRQIRLRRDADAARADKEKRKAIRNNAKAVCFRWLLLCLAINFGAMALIKYTHVPLGFVIKLGVSFYTFQLMGYAIDVYRERVKPETSLPRLALFAAFFPLLIQGPINRHSELAETLYQGGPLNGKNLSFGAQRILWGFFKKLVIADRLAPVMNTLLGGTEPYPGVYAFIGMVLYAVTLYADFTGGIDIAIGAAEMFGIKATENFNRPFYSANVAEYWRRWHITMGTWFKDYIFYPLSVCKPMLRLSKAARSGLGDAVGKRVTVYISLLTVWFLTGLWHDATGNYIVWGLTNGVVLLITQELQPLYDKFHGRFTWADGAAYRGFQIVRTFVLMCFIRSIDRYESVGTAFRMIGSVFTDFNLPRLMEEGMAGLGIEPAGYTGAGIGLAVVLWVSFLQRKGEDVRERLVRIGWPLRYAVTGIIFLMIVVFGAYGIGFDARQFIYNRF